MQDWKRQGVPMPGNKAIAELIGSSQTSFTALLSTLRARHLADYEWRPAPTDDDPTRQQRFVTKA